jgi:Type I phosphodiesterase / nucleotide pyrophosphatase
VLPEYTGANVRGIVPALLAPGPPALPPWMPAQAAAEQVVLLVIDGLGWEQLGDHPDHAPVLSSMTGGPITTVAPSTTATALTSIATGLTPGEHGLIGYRIDLAGEVLNVLRWSTSTGDATRVHEPRTLQPFPAFLGEQVPIVGRTELETSSFTQAHLRGGRGVGYRMPSGIPVIVADLLRAGERFVYVYYDGVDKIAHERGLGEFYLAEVRAADRLVADIVDILPAGACLLVTADHGQVQVGEHTIVPDSDVLRLCKGQSGEGRFRWLHARPGAAGDLLEASRAAHGDVAWVLGRDEMIAEGWFGPVVSPPVASRLGDVALVAHADVSFSDPADSGPFQLQCRHGSLTSAEMLVPLLAATGG